MGLETYISGWAGILNLGAYLFLFVLALNPTIFKMFRLRTYGFLALGVLASVVNSRAIMPFMLLAILDLDYSRFDADLQKKMMLFFLLGFMILAVFWRP